MNFALRIALVMDESDKARTAAAALSERYEFIDITKRRAQADVIVVLGGDGFMLQTMHTYMDKRIPLYGMNCGTVGFLLNQYSPDRLLERLEAAKHATLMPLCMFARTTGGREVELLAFNEVSLFRQSRQACKIRVTIDHVLRIPEMISDGILVATPAGSTAYNFSAGGPILPLDANSIALTPLSPFRPRRWKGALLNHNSSVNFEILESGKRPVSAVADFTEVRDVISVAVSEKKKRGVTLMFDAEHNLEERIINEQFVF